MKNENFDRVLSIAKKLDQVADGKLFECPECGEWIHENSADYNEQHDINTCPCCGAEFNSDDAEPVGMYDYFEDCYDVTYYSTGRGPDDYKGVRVMVACGGPNIYIDSFRGTVELYWWSETATCDLSRDTVEAIDDAFSELWTC